MTDTERREEYFSRLGATHDMAEELADEFETVSEFLATPFEEKLRVIVGSRQAAAIAAKYDIFEHMRDYGGSRAFRMIDGVGGKSAMRVDHSYICRTSFTPRDVLSAEALAEKMGFETPTPRPDAPQAPLGR